MNAAYFRAMVTLFTAFEKLVQFATDHNPKFSFSRESLAAFASNSFISKGVEQVFRDTAQQPVAEVCVACSGTNENHTHLFAFLRRLWDAV